VAEGLRMLAFTTPDAAADVQFGRLAP